MDAAKERVVEMMDWQYGFFRSYVLTANESG
jgi:hypothetical protein